MAAKCWPFFHCNHYVYRNDPGVGSTVYYLKEGPLRKTRCVENPTTRSLTEGYDMKCCRCGRVKFVKAAEYVGR